LQKKVAMIKFSPPRIDEKTVAEVNEALLSGWITTGPKTKLLEKKITDYCNCKSTLCVNSATAGLELVLRWFGVGPGDEVIVPAYTYCATANVVLHCGATPVIVDINAHDFNISVAEIRKHITSRTKVIIPVDFAGFPCDYDEINKLVNEQNVKKLFHAETEEQHKLGRILVLSDSAHSFGAKYNGQKTGTLTDMSVFSFHAVKNLTTAEGGAIAFNLPVPFDNIELYKFFNTFSLHGQNKDAMAKFNQAGSWRYDVIMPGYKCNMPDILAAIGLVEFDRYDTETLPRRKQIFDTYASAFSGENWAELPEYETAEKISSYHVFALRIKNIFESQRDAIIQSIFSKEVSVNVHFQPLPLLSYYKKLGYTIDNYPVSFDSYSREISLPVYYDLTDDEVKTIINAVKQSVEAIIQ
jgi:dTDP-4-amino-4,6-dideoxygalactose transaminase